MKKVVLIQHYGNRSGSVIGLLQTAKMLVSNYEVVLYIPFTDITIINEFKSINVNVKPLIDNFTVINYYNGFSAKFISRTFLKPIFHYLQSSGFIDRIIKIENPDIVICNSMVLHWIGKKLKKHHNYKLYCHVRETLPEKKTLFSKYIISKLNSFDGVLFISDWDRKAFSLKTKTCVVRDSLDKDVDVLLEDAGVIHSEGYCLAYVGGDASIKGFDIFVETMKALKKRTNILLAGKYSENARKKLQSINGDNVNIIFLGELSNIYTALLNADVLVCPSTHAHQLRPIFEAGYAYKPVITTKFKELEENIIDGFNGLTITRNSPQDLLIKIEKLRNDDQLRATLGKNNYTHAVQFHSFDSVKRVLIHFLSEDIEL